MERSADGLAELLLLVVEGVRDGRLLPLGETK
jgi:hypothetical protein